MYKYKYKYKCSEGVYECILVSTKQLLSEYDLLLSPASLDEIHFVHIFYISSLEVFLSDQNNIGQISSRLQLTCSRHPGIQASLEQIQAEVQEVSSKALWARNIDIFVQKWKVDKYSKLSSMSFECQKPENFIFLLGFSWKQLCFKNCI